MNDPVKKYANDVLAGRIVAGPHVRNACQRHMDDLRHGHARGIHFDPVAALRMIDFFSDLLVLSHGEHDEKPFHLAPSQQFIIGSFAGWKNADGARRFRKVYLETGKGSGKSPLMAGIGMYGMLADGEKGALILNAASTKDQAKISFAFAVQMFRKSAVINKRLTATGINPVHVLTDIQTNSIFKPVSRDEGLASGIMPHFVLLDEVHELVNGDMINLLIAGFKSRRQPCIIMSTNSGFDRRSVCWEEHQHGIRVCQGSRDVDGAANKYGYVGEVIDDTTFAYICALDVDDDYATDESCWIKANPLLGTTISYDWLRKQLQEGKNVPSRMASIERLNFCLWNDSNFTWISRESVDSCMANIDIEDYRGCVTYAGIDLASKNDMTAIAFVVPTGVDETTGRPTYVAWVEAWTPAGTLAGREVTDHSPYAVWVKEGYLRTCVGARVRYGDVALLLAHNAEIYDIQGVAYDTYAFESSFSPEMSDLGLEIPVHQHPQAGYKRSRAKISDGGDEVEGVGLWMPGSLSGLEDAIKENRITFRRSPVLVSAFLSAVTEKDKLENHWLSKSKASARIDAAVAMCMAFGLAMSAEIVDVSVGRSYLESSDILFM